MLLAISLGESTKKNLKVIVYRKLSLRITLSPIFRITAMGRYLLGVLRKSGSI